eukprot:TRINITY_DN8423_c0_g2_i3.p1 TRINITY_DN8423_c0_g2~~TRINITY_DN8423_c0_g2_i3.p1  ORF type:complete len:156 (+),score=55.23 TRINITY_DN8423_c0_g2_i3:47-469(+)
MCIRDSNKIVVQDETLTGKKRRRDKEAGEELDAAITADEDEAGAMVRKMKKMEKEVSRKRQVHLVKQSGEMYKPKDGRTGGDIVLPGKPDPYAFIQLNPKALNKRNRGKITSNFEFIVGGAKKTGAGSLKGLKKIHKETE